MESAYATDPANYRIEPDVKIQKVSLEGRHGKTAVLKVAGLEDERLRSFTITAWLNRTSDEEGPGGNRIIHTADTLIL